MARRSKTTETYVGQHLALAVAAHLARTQLVRDPLAAYDPQHNVEMLNRVGSALARTARLYVPENETGQPRELMQTELEGALAKKGATVLVLKDGRTLSAVSIKRTDLQQAVAILKAVGIAELRPPAGDQQNPNPPKTRADGQSEQLRARLTEIEALLNLPLLPSQAERASVLAISLARDAPCGRISNLAMHLISAVHDARRGGNEDNVRTMLARLRAAVDEIGTTST